MLTAEVKIPSALFKALSAPAPAHVAQAGARGVGNLLVSHLRQKDKTAHHRPGWPRSGFYIKAAESVRVRPGAAADALSATAVASVSEPGVRLRRFGGVARPTGGRKYIAIPARPEVAHIWPSRYSQASDVFLVARRALGKAFLAERDPSGHLRILWFLVRQTVHKPDPSVLPSQSELQKAAEDGARELFKPLARRQSAPGGAGWETP